MTFRPALSIVALFMMMATLSTADDFALTLRHQIETAPDSGRYHRLTRPETWNASETAVIVCDVWDLHHSQNAVRRLEEFAPRLDEVLKEARRRGATIIHSPSDCMNAYADHPARARAIETPQAADLPDDIKSWCSRIPAEEQAVYPLDQSDGGDDDDPEEHKVWASHLKTLGRNPGLPWQKQSDLITIDAEADYISDRGDEVWSILAQRGIKNVILTGVHVNMCVLGRPFGLRQMARNGKHVVLMRDMTDTMYNPARWPYVSHFTGND
ncbi:MAG: nicotinamidase, partial [Planctomycetota bacterium]